MTQKDESPNASEGPYWSEELLAVLVVGLGDETQARETLEGIIQQALSGSAALEKLRHCCTRRAFWYSGRAAITLHGRAACRLVAAAVFRSGPACAGGGSCWCAGRL